MRKAILLSSLLMAISAPVLADDQCTLPTAPIVPDGTVASEDELVATSKAIKSYQGDLQGYRTCLQAKEKAINPEAETAKEQSEAILGEFNASVDAETKVSEEFNAAVRAFKAKDNN